ncbi:MAG: 1-acyl-sn-glycerol-3-phosphate acyltransferase [Devosiaceae bacterium]|nr:1-acyl-sn-glycerol-3-phosphate acyltransferase [Devosiaceae bacterium MH13]
MAEGGSSSAAVPSGGEAAKGPGVLKLAWAAIRLLPLVAVFVVIAPLQWLANLLGWRVVSGALPVAFHKTALWCLGVRVRVEGAPLATGTALPGPALMVGNHVSWLDIVILGSLMPVRFVSKDDVAQWPVLGTLAKLQNTLFVSRTKRQATGQMADAMQDALNAGDRVIFFPEGTSSDGGQVLPFLSSLFGAVMGPGGQAQVQPFVLAYLRRDGLIITRGERATLGWYGDLDLLPNLLEILLGGPLDVSVILLEPRAPETLGDRKQMARSLEADVRRTLANRLRKA